MEIVFAPKARQDLKSWNLSGSNKIKQKISELIIAIEKDPFRGIGKPEPLKHEFSGCWSRRINQEHRIIYEITENTVHILSLKDHY